MPRSDLIRRLRRAAGPTRRRSVRAPGSGGGPVTPISIVVPARNVEATIRRMLDSVLAQTSSRWELVLVDDGSTDATAKIIDEVVGRHPNVTVTAGPELGVSAARNVGTELARHDHVLYLDADDWIGERFVELMGGALTADPSLDGVRCVWAYETPDGRTQPWDDLDLSDLYRVAATRCPFAIHACVIRRDLVRSLGGFDTGLVIGEDWDLWQRVGRVGGRLGFVPEVLAYYFLRPESAMHRNHERSQLDLVEVTNRGARADDRVRDPLPRYRDGIPLALGLDVESEVLAGTLAGAVPTDTDLASLLPEAGPDPTKLPDAETVAGTLHEAVAFGSCALLSDWLDLHPRVEPRIREMLELYCGWLGRPSMVEEVLRALEDEIARSVPFDEPVRIGRTLLQPLDLRQPLTDLEVDDGIEQVVAAVSHGDSGAGYVTFSRLDGAIPAGEQADVIARYLGPRLLRRALDDRHLAGRLAPHLADREGLRGLIRFGLDVSWERGAGQRATAESFLRWNGRRAVANLLGVPDAVAPWLTERPPAPPVDDPTGPAAPDETVDTVEPADTEPVDAAEPADTEPVDAAEPVDTEPVDTAGVEPRIDPDRREFDDSYGEAYFDSIFEEADPWSYAGRYEQTKYTQTLDVLGDRRFANAVELACAEGHFTVQLAPRVDRLLAADISPTALERAAERCRDHTNVSFGSIDLRNDELPDGLDLIVCSEVLYFLDSEPALADLAGRFARALQPGGLLVMAHANLIVDDPDRTGFDWGHEFGARRIGEIVAADPGLRLVSTNVSELYRIHLLERVEPGSVEAAIEPEEVAIPIADDLDTHIRRMALWGGAVTTRDEAFEQELAYQVPILMYHRVSPEGNPALDAYRLTPETFERQLDHLRANGYYGISFEQLRYSLASKRPLPGRAVLISFDDGYQDFFDHAWPLLRDYEFPASVFVVTDLVGEAATWDRRFGEPAPLMDWDAIRELHANGIEFGSHTASHRSLRSLTVDEIVEQERRCRATLQRRLGDEVVAMAYPFGIHDEQVEVAMRRVGYELAVTTKGWLATVWHDPMRLPRVDIVEADGTDRFDDKLGRRGATNPARRLAVGAKRLLRPA
ncbi:MAG: glycosyltransferase [Actinomycetota bacterium]